MSRPNASDLRYSLKLDESVKAAETAGRDNDAAELRAVHGNHFEWMIAQAERAAERSV